MTSRTIGNWVLSGMFVLGLWLPLFDQLLKLRSVRLNEQRELARAPAPPTDLHALRAFPAAFDAWYFDRFGLRTDLIRMNGRLLLWLFPDSERVTAGRFVVGKEGWLFYSGDHALEDYAAVQPFREDEAARCRAVLTDRAAWLGARGIAYVVMVAPEKHTIYPEYLPGWVRRVGAVTCFDQFKEIAGGIPGVSLVDPRHALLQAKSRERIYAKTDTHWNARGALVASHALVEVIAARVPLVRALDAIEGAPEARAGDLARMLGLGDDVREEHPVVALTEPSCATMIHDVLPSAPAPVAPFAMIQDRPDLPRAVVFHDSFFRSLEPFFSACFRRTAYYWQRDFDHAVIERERPDVVVEEVAERMLRQIFAPGPIELSGRFDSLPRALLALEGDWSARSEVTHGVAGIDAGGMALSASNDDPQVLLPRFDAPGRTRLLVRADVTAPADTRLQIFFATRDEPSYSEARSAWTPLKKGRSRVVLELPEADVVGRLRFDPGAAPGAYVVHSLEIRY